MKKQILFLSAVMFGTLNVFAQTPYDNFAPEQNVKSMIELPQTQFKVANTNTDSEIRYVEFDKRTLSLNLLDERDNVLKLVVLNPNDKKFLTIDPHAENYPNVSPYAFCLNNPVKYVDPDGRDVKIWYQDENNKWRAWTFNGKNQDQAPKNQFVSDFVTSYNYNIENGGGDKMQAAATATDYTLNLKQTEGNSNFQTTFNGPRTEGTVFWNPSEGLETSQGTLSPATILEHEMDHGVEWQTNTPEYRENRNTSDSHFGNLEEKRVITGSEYKTGVANGELKPVPKGKIGNSSSYRRHSRDSKNVFIPVIFPISNKKKP